MVTIRAVPVQITTGESRAHTLRKLSIEIASPRPQRLIGVIACLAFEAIHLLGWRKDTHLPTFP